MKLINKAASLYQKTVAVVYPVDISIQASRFFRGRNKQQQMELVMKQTTTKTINIHSTVQHLYHIFNTRFSSQTSFCQRTIFVWQNLFHGAKQNKTKKIKNPVHVRCVNAPHLKRIRWRAVGFFVGNGGGVGSDCSRVLCLVTCNLLRFMSLVLFSERI